MTRSIRMLRCDPDDTLNGYVFTDFAHARAWLRQSFVDRYETKLEEVEVGEPRRCRTCGGSGVRQTIKAVRKLSVDEFLKGPDA